MSDSNVRAPDGYLEDVARHLADPGVGLVTHPVGGVGEESLGSTLENLHAAAAVGPATVAAKVLAGRDVVVGKSMALRREDLVALGGFAVGPERPGRGLCTRGECGPEAREAGGDRLGRHPRGERAPERGRVPLPVRPLVRHATEDRRDSGLRRAGPALPAPLRHGRARLRARGPRPSASPLLVWLTKALVDGATARILRGAGFGIRVIWLSPLKDVLFLLAFARAFTENTVQWRGNRLLVQAGSRLERVA